ncbi:unnamed protein product [Durusdinium trenchii]|uniref:Uncharacterized protein n=1 Tax=Durusdinium trenchii TaxID=1381693 RepID=A0ABP0I6W9_9DINO
MKNEESLSQLPVASVASVPPRRRHGSGLCRKGRRKLGSLRDQDHVHHTTHTFFRSPLCCGKETLEPNSGAVRIFELVAQFLEQCNFTTAAHAVLAQCSEHVPALEEVLRRFRGHIDHCALLLSDLEAGEAAETLEAAFIQDLLDNLLRKLMASGQCLSDEKLLSCIDATLKSDAFPKLDVADIVLDPKQVDTSSMLNISEVDTFRFWESIQKEMQPLPEASYSAWLHQLANTKMVNH